MSEFIDPEEAVKKDTRRAWKFIIVAFVLVFGVFAGVMLFYDCSPPDDSSIMPKFTESPGGYNPLAVFLEEVKGDSLKATYDALSLEARSRDKGTEPEMKDYLATQTLPLQVFEKLMQTDRVTWRWPGGAARASMNFKSNHAATCSDMGKLLRLKVHMEASEGRMENALKTSLQLLHFGSGLELSEGTTIDNLVAITVSAIAKQSLEQALLCGKAEPALLADVQREMAGLESRRQDFIMTMKMEALFFKNAITLLKRKDAAAAGQLDGWMGVLALFTKPSLTLASRIHYLSPVIDGYEMSWKEGWRASQKMNLEHEEFYKNWFRFWISPNAGGNYITKLSLPAMLPIYGKSIVTVTMTRQIDVMLAMRRYELEEGKLPDTLEALVPKYISAVPLDPFDEAPLRWNAKTKVIYGVGEDGKDEGGKTDPRRGISSRRQTFCQKPDVSMIYWWSEEAKHVREGKAEEDPIALIVKRKPPKPIITSKLPKSKSSSKVPTETDQKK